MNAHRQHQMDRATVERLLDGSAADSSGVPEGLVGLLTTLRAAPLPHELAGEDAAVRGFHTARRDPTARPADRPVRQHGLTRLLSVKAAVAALAVVATGGVAFAAVQGAIPHPLRPAEPVRSVTPSDRPSEHSDRGDSTASPSSAPATDVGQTPTPALVELCRAYRSGDGDERARLLRTPAGQELVTDAGGRGQVDDYCTAVLERGRQPSTSPRTPGGAPATGPGGAPATGPARVPTARPSGRPQRLPATPTVPTSVPTSVPTAVPTSARPTAPAPPVPRIPGTGGDTDRGPGTASPAVP